MQVGSIASPMSIEEVKAMLDTTEKGGVRNSIKNCLTVFQHDPLLSGAIAYNLLTDRTKAHRLRPKPQQFHDRHGHEIYSAVSGRKLRPDK